MSIEDNKRLVRQFYAALDNEDYAALDDFCHKDFVFYSQVDKPKPGVAGLIASEKASFEVFESFSFSLQRMVAEGDAVAAYLLFEGKNHNQPFMGIEPRNKNVRLSVFCLLTIKDGKIIEKRAHYDSADSHAQLTAK